MTPWFFLSIRVMPALKRVTGNNHECVYYVQYVTVGFKDQPDNAITVFSFAVEVRKASGIS